MAYQWYNVVSHSVAMPRTNRATETQWNGGEKGTFFAKTTKCDWRMLSFLIFDRKKNRWDERQCAEMNSFAHRWAAHKLAGRVGEHFWHPNARTTYTLNERAREKIKETFDRVCGGIVNCNLKNAFGLFIRRKQHGQDHTNASQNKTWSPVKQRMREGEIHIRELIFKSHLQLASNTFRAAVLVCLLMFTHTI